MSRFFVGQRVRMVRPVFRQNLGLEGVISELFPEQNALGGPVNCHVRWSGAFVGDYSHTEQLEPILPDGHRSCDEDFKRDLDKMLEGMPA